MALNLTVIGKRDPALSALLRASGLVAMVSWSDDLEALTAAGAAQPDAVLIDLRGRQHVPAVLPIFKRQHPGTGVVIIASTLDPTLMLEAMRAGVTECITDPIAQAELTAAIGRVVAQRAATAGGVFAFVGAKGGVGTTTVAVNVATALAKLSPARALMLDLHLAYGDAGIFLGAQPRFSVVDALENLHRFDPTFFGSLVVPTASGLDLLASSDRTSAGPFDSRKITALIDFASRQYPYTILDLPLCDGSILDALDQVATIVVVANQELATVRNAGRVASALRARYGRAKIMTVISRADGRAELDKGDIERAVGGTIAHRVPSDYRRALNAMHVGRPLTLDNHNALSASLTSLARGLAGLDAEPLADRPTGFIGRLAGRR